MISNSLLEQDLSLSHVESNTPEYRYAWLEKEGTMWHFLTNLFSDPAQSTRRWSNKQHALEELAREGWTVLHPYPECSPAVQRSHSVCGYGLMWIDP
jgi:hypothetical protein